MAFTGPLVLKANFTMGTSSASAFDVSPQITSIVIKAERDTVIVPPTGTTGEDAMAGTARWTATINWLGNDVNGATTPYDLTRLFYAALLDTRGELFMKGTLRAGAASSINPAYSASFIVLGLGLGGDQEKLFTDSQTVRLKAAPSISLT